MRRGFIEHNRFGVAVKGGGGGIDGRISRELDSGKRGLWDGVLQEVQRVLKSADKEEKEKTTQCERQSDRKEGEVMRSSGKSPQSGVQEEVAGDSTEGR